jgi:hypothetical protein
MIWTNGRPTTGWSSCWPSTGASIISRKGTGSSSTSRVETTPERPHGLSYSFTLHAPDGTRLVGFDNAHNAPAGGSRFKRRGGAADHWHRTEKDPGRPYMFKDAETLLDDFFDEVERVLCARGVGLRVIKESERLR